VVHCALWLVVSLGSLAGVYLVLGAEVVALVQLLVYVGAVVVLVIFALMLTQAPIEASRRLDAPPGQRVAAAVSGVALAAVLAGTLLYAVGDDTVRVDSTRGSARAVGTAVFGGWLLPFELLSVLLLAALVAALAISRPVPASPTPASPTPAGKGQE
jgi:NADH-quinone oxidoreductase subunit J